MIEQKQSKTLKTKVNSLYEETPKQFLSPTQAPKVAHQGPKKAKNDPKIKSKSNVGIEGSIRNISKLQNKISDPKPTSKVAQKGSKLFQKLEIQNARKQKRKITKLKLSIYMSKLYSTLLKLKLRISPMSTQLQLSLNSISISTST